MNKRPVTSQNYRSSEKDLKVSNQKLPNLSEVMNMRIKQSQELQENYQNLVRQAQNLQQQCVQKDKQISQYEFMIKSLQIAIEKRDCIIAALRQQQQQQMADMQIIKAPKTEESSRMSKRIGRVRTKETNFDETLQNILENDYGSMARYMDQYRALSHLRMIQELVENEEAFVQKVQKLDYGGIVNIFDAINLLLNEHKMLFKNNIKINKLFEQSLILGDNIPLNEQLDTFTEILKDSLDCHKSQIFILDNENQELWCQTKEKQIRISVNEDIIGACFQEKNLINVHNAYNDTRFKKENDRGYKTQTILLTPILDKQNNPIGVLEAINKMQGHFSQDDQLQIQKISELVSILLSTQQQSNESISIQNSLRNIIQAYLHVAYLENIDEILLNAEYYLKNLFHTQKGYVYLVNNQRYIRAISKGQIEEYPKGIGIIGQTEKSKELIWVQNAYNHQNFNSLVDINTTMPIYSKLVVGKKYQIIIQVINNKGIRAQKMSSFDQELLELFGSILLSHEFVSLVLRGEVNQSNVTKLQQFVFSEKIKRKQELKEYYISILQKYSEELSQKQLLIQDNVEFQLAYKDSLIKLSQLGFFLAAFFPTNIFPEGFAIIRELFIEKFPILQDREVLQIVRASGFNDLRIRYNLRSLIFQSSQISNEYFDKRFVNQYIQKVIDSKPQQDDQIYDYVQKSNHEIDFLFPDMKESIQLQIHKIIANYLYDKIDFNNLGQVQITSQVYDLISAQFDPQYKYGQKQKLGTEFNPYLQLAGRYKDFIAKFKINNFKELEAFNSQQKQFLTQYFTNSKYLQIQLLELIESKLQIRNNISFIFDSAQSNDFFKCSINLFQEYCSYAFQRILENIGHQSCLQIKTKLEDLKSLVNDRILIKQVNELIEIINNGQLYIKKPLYTNLRIEQIENIPNELQTFIEKKEEDKQKKVTLTKYGYAEIIWLNKYEINVTTKQLLVLIALQNQEVVEDQTTLKELEQIGFVKDGKINSNFIPKAKNYLRLYK
ncbi:hypothetical protein pb186bvf_000626 [Paramecium bursaria]